MPQMAISGFKNVIKVLCGIFIILFVLNSGSIVFGFITGHHSVYGILGLFDFNSQGGLPYYFSSFCLALSGAILYFIYWIRKKNHFDDSRYWLVLAIGFLFMSVDEYVGLHRLLTVPLREALHIGRLFYFAWVIPGLIVCLLLGIYFFKFFWHLPNRFKGFFGISALLFIGGAIGIEIIDGFYAPADGSPSLIYSILYTLEQTLEWGAELIFLYSLVNFLEFSVQLAPLHIPAVKAIPQPAVNSGKMVVSLKSKQ